MDTDNPDFTLPPAPRGLCFDRNDFVKTNFSVDLFLAEHQNVVTLERMRDDLGVYLKVLRLAMIELINRDYVNFVNLSATHIGFDKAIAKIQVPLVELNEEIQSVKQCLEDAMKELSMRLTQRSNLYKKKQLLKHYSQTLNSLTTLDNILNKLSKGANWEKIALADRGVMQYNQLKFSISHCGALIKSEQKTQFNQIGEKLSQTLNELLYQYLNEGSENNLLQSLMILASLDRVTETEELLRKKSVAPLLQDIINETTLQRTKNGLQGVYDKIISLLDNDLHLLLTVTQHSKLTTLNRRYRFLVNCFWCEVATRLEINLSSIFAPGNPKIFYNRYKESLSFVGRLEKYCPDEETVRYLRATKEFKSFQKRWNLPVYFQIRFQEIAGVFEAALQETPTLQSHEDGFLLRETQNCWRSLHECWKDGVYIEALAHKFWKLSLQLLSRYATWVNSVCSKKPQHPKLDVSINKELLQNSINLHLDTQQLVNRLPEFLKLVQTKISIPGNTLSQSLKDSEGTLKLSQSNIKDCVVKELYEYLNNQLKQVSDIPRLYRKTNRNIPSKPCSYVENVARTLEEFHGDISKRLNPAFLVRLYEDLFNTMTNSYFKSVEDVLTSVQKTEESLRRLKQIREGTPQQASEVGVTDGDKIRLQLNVDVVAFGNLAQTLGLNVNNIEKFKELSTMVTEAIKNIDIK